MIGSVPSFSRVVAIIEGCAGLFYVNKFPEVFSLTLAITEALGRRVHMLCLHGMGGAREYLDSPWITTDRNRFMVDFCTAYGSVSETWPGPSRRDFSKVAILPRWIAAFGLGGRGSAASAVKADAPEASRGDPEPVEGHGLEHGEL